jgi:hypothetical protein
MKREYSTRRVKPHAGNIVSEFNSAFATEIDRVIDVKVGIDLGKTPVYIEGYEYDMANADYDRIDVHDSYENEAVVLNSQAIIPTYLRQLSLPQAHNASLKICFIAERNRYQAGPYFLRKG